MKHDVATNVQKIVNIQTGISPPKQFPDNRTQDAGFVGYVLSPPVRFDTQKFFFPNSDCIHLNMPPGRCVSFNVTHHGQPAKRMSKILSDSDFSGCGRSSGLISKEESCSRELFKKGHSMRVEDAQREDMAVLRLLNEAEVPHVNSVDLDGFAGFLKAADYFRVARDGDAVVGFLIGYLPGRPYDSLNYRWFDARYTSFLYVDRIVVSPDARGRGVGRRLYDDFTGFAAGRADRLTCEVNVRPPNDASMRFHRNYGFEEVGRQETEGGTKEVSLMVKLLGQRADDQNHA
jgi:predicted GNAT superfamily acetyltransferase